MAVRLENTDIRNFLKAVFGKRDKPNPIRLGDDNKGLLVRKLDIMRPQHIVTCPTHSNHYFARMRAVMGRTRYGKAVVERVEDNVD